MENHIQRTLNEAAGRMGKEFPHVEAASEIRKSAEGRPVRVSLIVVGFNNENTCFMQHTQDLRQPRRSGLESLQAQKKMLDHEIELWGLTMKTQPTNEED